jgi:hypothetical protein
LRRFAAAARQGFVSGMGQAAFHRRAQRVWLLGLVLPALLLRALIPPGFMPASDRPFSIEICWEGFPAGILAHGGPSRADSMATGSSLQAHHHHPGIPSHSEHCVFGTACGAGPIPYLPPPSDISPAQLLAVAFGSIAVAVRLVHLPQPRAPPVV